MLYLKVGKSPWSPDITLQEGYDKIDTWLGILLAPNVAIISLV